MNFDSVTSLKLLFPLFTRSFCKRSLLCSLTFLSFRTLQLAYPKLVWTPCIVCNFYVNLTFLKVVRNSDELFDRSEFSAAPDAGWPDCFNSGVFVFSPNKETFNRIMQHAATHGSFDGGDQGLLNTFFSSWSTQDITKHLPFLYNMCATATYSYLPAFK